MVPAAGRPRLPAHERRELIERSATRLFAERGYASTSVDDVVRSAGVTKPMLYRHFESKQDLCVRLLEGHRDALIGAALEGLADDGPEPAAAADGRVERMIDGWLTWAEAHPHAVRLLFVPVRGDEAVERAQGAMWARQRDTQAALIRELAPATAPGQVEPLAEVVRAGFAAMAIWVTDEPGRREAARLTLLQLARGVLAGAAPTTREGD